MDGARSRRMDYYKEDMGRSIPSSLAAYAFSTASYSSSYVPLQKLSAQITRTALTGDVDRLDRLWQLLCLNYPLHNLMQCFSMPEPFTNKTILMLATEEKLVKIVAWLLDAGCEDDGMTITEDGDTILHLAAACDASDIISLYTDRFSQAYDDEEAESRFVDWRNDKGASPLCVACKKGHVEVVRTLISLGASVELEDHRGDTPLHYAASYGHLPIVRTLLLQGASAFAKNNLGYSASDVAFSFEVEQDIQNTVRSALEANKRLRSAKASAATTANSLRSRQSIEYSDEDDMPGNRSEDTTLDASLIIMQTPKTALSPGARTPGAKLQAMGIPRPALSISTNTTPMSSSNLTTPISRVTSRDLPQPSSSLDPESSKALQRILARDQNAQAGFHTSTAYRGLVGPALPIAIEASISPYSTLSKESGYFSSRPPGSTHRGRSSSNEVISGSYTSSHATGSSSSSTSSPQTSIVHAPRTEGQQVIGIPMGAPLSLYDLPPVPPLPFALPIPPHSALPALPSMPKSSTSSFVNKLKRSGSSSASTSTKPISPLDAVFPSDIGVPFGKRSVLKHHASMADLRSQAASTAALNQAPAQQVPFISRTAFGFGKSRTRSGT